MRGTGVEYRPVCEFAPDYDAKVPWVGTFVRDAAVGMIGLVLFIVGMLLSVEWVKDLNSQPEHTPQGEEAGQEASCGPYLGDGP